MPRILLMALLAAPAAAHADTFQAFLGSRPIGTLETSAQGESATLATRLENTPFGVADGAFEATSAPARTADGETVVQYLSRSAFTTSSRTVSILFAAGRVAETTIDPEADRSELSEPAAVPAGVVDLAQAFARLASAGGCPGLLLVYDGRRVGQLATESSEAVPEGTLCHASYDIVAGPGLLSPLGVRSFDLEITYAASGSLLSLEGSAGPFGGSLVR